MQPLLKAHSLHPPSVADAERLAIQRARQQTDSHRSSLRSRLINAAVADGHGGATSPGVRWWLKYLLYGRGRSPITRLTANSPLAEKLEAEQLMMDFAVWLAMCRPSGRPISARTISKYLSAVRAWHRRTQGTAICGDLDNTRLKDLVRGIARSQAQPEPKQRWGVRTQDLAQSIERFLNPDDVNGVTWAAALTTAFCGLMRGAEFALQAGETFDPAKHLTRADVQFRTSPSGQRYVVLRMRPAKGKPGATKSVPLMLAGGGTLLDPVVALERLFAMDPVPESEMATTPLFSVSGRAISVAQVRTCVKSLMAMLGLDARRFGAHSLRIGGATAALAANMSPAAIRAAGRWSSDVYMLYTRASRQAAMHVATVIGSTSFEDMERGVSFDADGEILLTPAEMPSLPTARFVEQDLIDDAFADEAEA